LRAQRANPDSLREKILDCFAALAMTVFVETPYLRNVVLAESQDDSERFGAALRLSSSILLSG